jgi:hypothetical protein
MTLRLARCSYSAMPWRLILVPADGPPWEVRQAGVWWRTRRDGLPTLTALLALGLDWAQMHAWTDEQRAQVQAVLQPLIDAEAEQVAAWHERQMAGRSF